MFCVNVCTYVCMSVSMFLRNYKTVQPILMNFDFFNYFLYLVNSSPSVPHLCVYVGTYTIFLMFFIQVRSQETARISTMWAQPESFLLYQVDMPRHKKVPQKFL